MIWPHQLPFPYRIPLLILSCVFAGSIASFWPDLHLRERTLMPLFTVYGVASGFFTYGLLLMLLRFFPPFTISSHRFFSMAGSLRFWSSSFSCRWTWAARKPLRLTPRRCLLL
jgi:hypothetical protein